MHRLEGNTGAAASFVNTIGTGKRPAASLLGRPTCSAGCICSEAIRGMNLRTAHDGEVENSRSGLAPRIDKHVYRVWADAIRRFSDACRHSSLGRRPP